MRILRRAIGVCAALLITGTPVVAATIAVVEGANLQRAIDRASPGDTIALAPGATFIGNFTLPARTGDAVITIRTAGDDGLPADMASVSPRPTLALWLSSAREAPCRRFGLSRARIIGG